jgi:hypothetical protein
MQSHRTFESPCGTSSARWPIAKRGSVPIPVSEPSARIALTCEPRNSESVVHACPDCGTYWRGSSQIGQRSGSSDANWTPHVTQIKATATHPFTR